MNARGVRRGAFHMRPQVLRRQTGGYGIRPYDIAEIYLFLRREQALAPQKLFTFPKSYAILISERRW